MLKWDVSTDHLDPDFANDIDALFSADPDSWIITYGFRTYDEQNALYQKHLAGGPLAAPPGHSAHEHGLAVDFCQVVNGKRSWDTSTPGWARIMEAVDRHPRLHGGWKFPPEAPADDDHIQSLKWYAVRDQLKREGKW